MAKRKTKSNRRAPESKTRGPDLTKEDFLNGRNVVVFEHLTIKQDILQTINTHGQVLDSDVQLCLSPFVEKKFEKYNHADLREHIKLVYLFVTEGMKDAVSGRLMSDGIDSVIKKAFDTELKSRKNPPPLKLIGIAELRTILSGVEARMVQEFPDGVPPLREFLLGPNGHGGYDTPKFAAAVLQLARRDYERDECFIRTDDDVQLNVDGIRELKNAYYDLTHDPANKYFCFSWNYEQERLHDITASGENAKGPDYNALFRHFVNSYSIRTTFLGHPKHRCQIVEGKADANTKEKNKVQVKPIGNDDDKATLNLVHIKYFINL